jgi:hypothetical protein
MRSRAAEPKGEVMNAVGSNRPFASALASEKKAEPVTADPSSKETERLIKVALL